MSQMRGERVRHGGTGRGRRAPVYLVTGGAGFIGANLCAELTRRDPTCTVVVVDDMSSGSYANLVEAHERAAVDPFSGIVITDSLEQIDTAGLIADERPDAVFHLAAITDTTVADEVRMIRVNVDPFVGMVEECLEQGIPLVYASSAATYGTPPHVRERVPFPLDAAGKPNNVYGFSKWLLEREHLRAVKVRGGGHVVGLRYFNVFGPGESRKGKMASMVYQLARRMLAGQAPRIFRDGTQARDQVFVADVVDCTLAAAGMGERKSVEPGVYNVGSGVATSFNEIVVALRTALGLTHGELPTDYFDMPPDVRAFYQDYTCADISETQRGLGWSPRYTPEEGIAAYARGLRAGVVK